MLILDFRTAIHPTATATIPTTPLILTMVLGLIITAPTMVMDMDIAADMADIMADITDIEADTMVVTAVDIMVDTMADIAVVTTADMADPCRNSVRIKHLAYS